ncbi:head-tail adaptor protein [Patescibacteria group bacterium]|nr:head-tail adaptor protein [Patescibacteria group bacterium]MBU1999462.1 head-tail adaptor protein [Candidatus Omnitrophota bacterium]
MSYESFLNKTAIAYRKTTDTGKAIEDWVEVATINCMVVSVSPSEVLTDDLRRLRVDYKVFIPPNSGVISGDKLTVSGHSLIIKRVDDIALMNKVIECWATKI